MNWLKNAKLILQSSAIMIAIMLNLSCTTVYVHPELRPDNKKYAILDDPYFGAERSPVFIIIDKIDGRPRGVGAFKEYHLPEGQHTIKITKPSTRGDKMTILQAEHPIEISFTAIAGHYYKIMIIFDKVNQKWGGFIVDKQSEKVVSTMREVKG